MACAGYLVLDHEIPVFVDLSHGVLTCTPKRRLSERDVYHYQKPKTAASVSNAKDESERRSTSRLSFLARSWTKSRRSSSRVPHKLCDDDLVDCADCPISRASVESSASSAETASESGDERVLQLSGHIVEVVDKGDKTWLPHTFLVHTRKMTLDENCQPSSTPVDTILLTAPDHDTKKYWVKCIRQWKRQGWREPELLRADEADCEELEARLSSCESPAPVRESVCAKPPAFPRSTKGRTYRRHFYRMTTIPTLNQEQVGQSEAWFQTSVVKTHI